jgi:predicted esterase
VFEPDRSPKFGLLRRVSLAALIALALAPDPALALDPNPPAATERPTPVPASPAPTPAKTDPPPSAAAATAFVPGIPTWVDVPGDKQALVVQGPADSELAIVYLHGLCGNVRAVENFSAASARVGTVIALLGDRNCPAGRFKWGKDIDAIGQRIDQALRAVKRARGGKLDVEHPVLFGYSQGAAKAEQLVSHYPEKYRLVVLGGPPREPKLPHLGNTRAVVVFGGERETTGHMRAGTEVLAAAGKPVRFFLLPAAKHGEFGPEGNRLVGEMLSWLLDTAKGT